MILCFMSVTCVSAQILIDNTPPYNNPTWLVDNILLGGGIVASNHAFQGDPVQIGWFNALNTTLGIDSGIVMSTGDIYSLDPINGSTFPIIANTVTDPDLLNVANSVPPLINQTFSVSSINDVAILEFDFIPTSDSLNFRYVFGSQEYFQWENSSYNDVFGFFLSGPGISGPYSAPAIHPNGSINLAIVPGSNPPLPITVSSVNNGNNGAFPAVNDQYFVDNSSGLSIIASSDGLTTVLTAKALVQCNEVYHIRLAIADGSDGALDSYVWLEAGSFSSPELNVIDNLGIDSTVMEIPCNATITLTADGGVGASYQWFDSTGLVISTDSFLSATAGKYWVEATSFGCPVISDTLYVLSDDAPVFDFGIDYTIPCNTETDIIPVVTGGLGNSFYEYFWNTGDTTDRITVGEGLYILEVGDGTGCNHIDSILITEDNPPTTVISGGGNVCDDGSTVDIIFSYNGLLPWNLTFNQGNISNTVNNISSSNYIYNTSSAGDYTLNFVEDYNGCVSELTGNAKVVIYPLPNAIISPSEVTIFIGDIVDLDAGQYAFYEWYTINDSLISTDRILSVSESGKYYIWVEDENGCVDVSNLAIVNTIPKIELFVPSVFTPNNDEHNELFVIKGLNILEFEIQIHNRWGEKVFESDSMEKYWDGYFNNIQVPQGTYSYYIKVLGVDKNVINKFGLVDVMY